MAIDQPPLASIFELFDDAVVIADQEACIRYVNPAFRRITGYRSEEVMGRSLGSFMRPVDQGSGLFEQIEKTLSSGANWRGEVTETKKDGSLWISEATISPVLDDLGKLTHCISIHRDTTKRKRTARPRGATASAGGSPLAAESDNSPIEESDMRSAVAGSVSADLSKYERAQQALAESAQSYREVVERSAQGILIHQDDKIVYVNQAAIDIYGYTFAEMIGMNVDTNVAPHDRGRLAETRQFRTEKWFEFQGLRRDGSLVWVGSQSLNIELHGRPARMNFLLNITEQREAEAKLRESEQRLRLLADSLPVAIISYDRSGRFLFANRVATEWFALTQEEMIGRHPRELVGKIFETEFASAVDQVHKGEQLKIERRMTYPDGKTRDVEVTYVPRFDKDGAVSGHFALVQDITQRKASERAGQRESELIRQTLDAAGIGLWEWDDAKGVEVWLTEAERRIRGAQENRQVTIRDWLETIHPDDRAQAKASFRNMGEASGPCRVNYRLIRPDGEVRQLRNTVVPWIDSETGALFYRGITQDETESKAMEEQLQQAQKMKAVGQLTGGIAHDFNNLLAIIIGNAELLESDLGEDDPTLNAMLRAAARGADLTQRLLTFSRQQALRPRAVDCNRLVGDLLELMRRTLGMNIEVEVKGDPDLWLCFADPGQLENAIVNLAINARDAMPDGGRLTIESGNVRIEEDQAANRAEVAPGECVVLAVRDTGVGIPPENLARVFEPFFTTKQMGGGSGLGLATVFGFAKQSGGHAAVSSELGRGTTVKLYLPRHQGDAAANSDDRQSRAIEPGGHETILMVEDDNDLRVLVLELLQSLGYNVLSTATGLDALDVLEGAPEVRLLLTDLMLPGGMSGQQLAQEAKSRRQGLPVLYMSGYSSDPPAYDGLSDESMPLLKKPFRRAEIGRRVRWILDRAAS